jgi:hypothetical protein
MDGVTYAEFHFSHTEENGGWVPAQMLKTQQSRSYDLHLKACAGRLDPKLSLDDASNYVGNVLPERIASKSGAAATSSITVYGPEWWKSHLKPEVYRRIFPTPEGRRPPQEREDEEPGVAA